jgi:transcriptional regulator with XRE-family HTH domain
MFTENLVAIPGNTEYTNIVRSQQRPDGARREFMIFGEWLKKQRTERKITQRDLAAAASISFSMVSRLENGQVGHSPEMLERIVDALASTPEEASAGLPPPNPAIEALAARLASLSAEDQQYVLTLIERLLQPQARQE